MGTREVYEQKLRQGNHLHHDPTINPGLGSPRCPRCLSLLDPSEDRGDWTINPVLHDVTAVAGAGIGSVLGMNAGFPFLKKSIIESKMLSFAARTPPLLMFAGVCAVFGGYALPKFVQLNVTSYYYASSASHYAVSLLTRHIEDSHTSSPKLH